MPFSQGQILFVIVFLAAFAIALVWAYRKERSTNKRYFSGSWKVLITLIIILATLSYILKSLHN